MTHFGGDVVAKIGANMGPKSNDISDYRPLPKVVSMLPTASLTQKVPNMTKFISFEGSSGSPREGIYIPYSSFKKALYIGPYIWGAMIAFNSIIVNRNSSKS